MIYLSFVLKQKEWIVEFQVFSLFSSELSLMYEGFDPKS